MKTRFADLFSRVRFSGVEICREHWGKLWPGRLGVRKIEVWVWVRSRAVPGGGLPGARGGCFPEERRVCTVEPEKEVLGGSQSSQMRVVLAMEVAGW